MKEHCRYAVKDFHPLIVGEEEEDHNNNSNNNNNNNNNNNSNAKGDNNIITAGTGQGLGQGQGLASGQGLGQGQGQGLGLGLEGLRLLEGSSDDSGESKSKVYDHQSDGKNGAVALSPQSNNQSHGHSYVAGSGLAGGAGLVTHQRVAVSRENSFGFFDPLTRACFQGHLR